MDDSLIEQGFEIVDVEDATQTIIETPMTTKRDPPDDIAKETGGDDGSTKSPVADNAVDRDDDHDDHGGRAAAAKVVELATAKVVELATAKVVELPATADEAVKKPQTKPVAADLPKPTKKLSPKLTMRGPKKQPAKKQPTKVQSVGVFSQLPEPVLGLALYKKPMKSVSAIAIVATAYALASIDFGYTLPFLLLRLLNAMLVIVLGATLGLLANDKFIVKNTTPKTTSPAEDVFKPILQKIESDFNILWGNATKSDSLVVSWVKQIGSSYLESLYCTKPLRTVKTIIGIHFTSKLVRCCSFPSLFLISACLFFTIPLLYTKNKAQIDPVVHKIKHTFDVVNDISISMFNTKPKAKVT